MLSDPEKRRVFDKYGKAGLQSGGGPGPDGSSGFSRGFSTGFSSRQADDIFRAFFGGKDPFANFFDDDDDDFFGRPFGSKSKNSGKQGGIGGGMGGFGGFDDDDDFFGRGFGGMGGFGGSSLFQQMQMGGMGSMGGGSSMFSSSSFSGGPGSQSISTQTYIENGKRVTKTTKTTVDAQGRKTT